MTITQKIYNVIEAINPYDDQEKTHQDDALAWIKSGVNIFRVAKPDKPPKHLVTYFMLVDPEHRSVLLGDHIKSQLWLPTGGHVELNEDPRATVMREVQEEVGRAGMFLHGNDTPFFITQAQTVGLTPGHTDVSLWYLVRGDVHEFVNFSRREFTDVEWFTFDEVLESSPVIFDPHMQRFIKKLQIYLAQ